MRQIVNEAYGLHYWTDDKDPADDGPEVKTIAFFRMFPEGSFSRRVSSVTEKEMRMRFWWHEIETEGRQNAKANQVSSKCAVSPASERREANSRRITRRPRLPV